MVESADSPPLLPGLAVDELYEETTRQQRWLSATAEVTRYLLSGAELSDALAMITEKALDMTGADLVMVTLPMADGRHQRIEHAAGDGAGEMLGLVVPMHDAVTELVVGKAQRLTLCDYGATELTGAGQAGRPLTAGLARVPAITESLRLGPMVVVPLGAPGQVRGVLSAGRRKGSAPLSQPAADMLATFAAHAAIALELAEHRRQAERMAIFEDRDRIAKDLHDLVIQRLYATGMSLQGTISLILVPEVADRVSSAVDALDDTIKEIRSAIFALHSHADAKPASLRSRILRAVQEMAPALGFAPSVRLDGSLEDAIPAQVTEQLLTAIREALANVARHANASRVELAVAVDEQVRLTVTDDGVGITPGGRRSGLRNLADRAAGLGGALAAEPIQGGLGTELVWQVPLHSSPTPTGAS
ncbi:MAG TPA: GAF domain-containing protein [Streptosporangiaceae bacterium]|nr:GAF domain-containing protein [Streptosporangiaceae bacterium]